MDSIGRLKVSRPRCFRSKATKPLSVNFEQFVKVKMLKAVEEVQEVQFSI